MPAVWQAWPAGGEPARGDAATRRANDDGNYVNAQPIEISGYAR
ncbi:MAG TPA: hypothetical protein VII34_10530 [Pyrinomonadaceae bacterium]